VTSWVHFKDYIEDFCIKRFQMNAAKGKAALEEALDRVYDTCSRTVRSPKALQIYPGNDWGAPGKREPGALQMTRASHQRAQSHR
jgi:hypothetical protein